MTVIGTYYSEGLNAYVVQAFGDWKRDGWCKWSPVRAFKLQGDAILFSEWLPYNLFHIDQCEGVAPKFANEPVKNEHTANEVAEAIIAEYAKRDALTLNVCESNQAFYSPSKDFVQVPQMSQYANEAEYYSTMFHELTHSTGHERRLNRKEVNTLHFFGDEDYSREELTAEMGAAFLCSQVGIDCAKAFKNSAAYIKGWLNHLRCDNKAIVIAAGKAERAAKYILTGEK